MFNKKIKILHLKHPLICSLHKKCVWLNKFTKHSYGTVKDYQIKPPHTMEVVHRLSGADRLSRFKASHFFHLTRAYKVLRIQIALKYNKKNKNKWYGGVCEALQHHHSACFTVKQTAYILFQSFRDDLPKINKTKTSSSF